MGAKGKLGDLIERTIGMGIDFGKTVQGWDVESVDSNTVLFIGSIIQSYFQLLSTLRALETQS